MANLKDTLKQLREQFAKEVGGAKTDDEALAAFDRSLASVLIDQLEPEEPKKRAYTRKPKPPVTE